jgi:RNA polymerase sigma factor (sigma-70 family)
MTLSPRGREQLVAVPSIGRATEVTPRRAAPEADATRELYERYARQIYTYCLHQLGNREEAEDATQSTFLNAFRGYKRGVDPEFESAWVYKIAQNVCLTRQRSSSRRRKVETPGDLDAMQDYVPAHQADSDELIRLPEALDAMPEQQRRALLLREWQGLSYKEIGEELELSQAAVETLLFRARRSLAAGLSEEPVKKASGIAKRLGASDLGSVLSVLKSLVLTGGIKVATAVATVAATSVVAATPVTRHAVEDIVTPRPDKAPVHHVSPKAAAAPSAAARVGAPSSLVPARTAASPATPSAPPAAVTAKARRHPVAASGPHGGTVGSGALVGHASRTTESPATTSAPTVATPTVETPAPAPVTDTTPPTHVDAPAPQPTATPPAPAPDKSKGDTTTTAAAPAPKKDDSKAGQGTTGSGATPAAVQQPAATTSATSTSTDRGLAAAKNSDKKNDSNKNDNKDAKAAAVQPQAATATAATPSVPTTTTATTTTTSTTTTTATTTTATTATATTATTTTAAPPFPVPAAAQPMQSDKSSRPADVQKGDGKGDNGGGNNGNGKKK